MRFRAGSWTSIIAIYAFGVISSAGFGKMVPLIPEVRQTFGVGGATAGLVISVLAVVGALGALGAGTAINRVGDREALAYSAILSVFANLGAFWASSVEALLLFRAIDGVACIVYAVAGPMLLMRTTTGARRTAALTLWATSISIGFQFGVLGSSVIATPERWRLIFLATAVLQVGFLLLTRAFPKAVAREERESIRDSLSIVTALNPMRLGIAFLVLTVMRAGLNTVIPHLFLVTYELPIAVTAAFASLSSLTDGLGSALSGTLLARSWRALPVGLLAVIPLLSGIAMFMLPGGIWTVALAGMLIFQFGNGWFAALLVTMLPQVRGSHSASSASGAFNQLSFIGLVFAAPLALTLLDRFGWQGIVGLAIACVASILLLMPLKGRFANSREAGPNELSAESMAA